MSYYKKIDGKNYDAALLEQAEQLTQGQGDGRIAFADAQHLWSAAQDGPGLTAVEKQTLHYLLQQFAWTDKARQFLEEALQEQDNASAIPTAQTAYERQRHLYWKAHFEGEEGNPWQDYLVDRVAPQLPATVKEAFQYYYQEVEQADWGGVKVYQFPLGEGYFYAVDTQTDGDDGWTELYSDQGAALGFGRTFLEQVYWGEKETIRAYVQNGEFPPEAKDKYDRNSW